MKRTIPLLITALGGFVLLFAFFIPATESWGEVTAIWFDILAAIAFLLGGGNLMKVHLKKVSDQAPGWGYSVVTLLSFLVMLYVGLFKIGIAPAANQQFYGETLIPAPIDAMPTATVQGTIPARTDGEPLHASVRRQISQQGDDIVFAGWMTDEQRADLKAHDPSLAWQCLVDRLSAAAQPPQALAGQATYHGEHQAIGFAGVMSETQRTALKSVLADAETGVVFGERVDHAYEQSRRTHTVTFPEMPTELAVPASLEDRLTITGNDLTFVGPMSQGQKHAIARSVPGFSLQRPLSEAQQTALLDEIGSPVPSPDDKRPRPGQVVLRGIWKVDDLRQRLDQAGEAKPGEKTACELLEEQQAGVMPLDPEVPAGESIALNEDQVALLNTFATDEAMKPTELQDQLVAAGPMTPGQLSALETFFAETPTIAERNHKLLVALVEVGPVTEQQKDLLLGEFREQLVWQRATYELFLAAHVTHYPWSGDYNTEGSPFWWGYEYVFKPLTATMFAMLGFYVASAAYRAFRAKNVEAILLLGTAFIILLGRTQLGVAMTAGVPDALEAFKIDQMTVYIMRIFNTAGNRAIMIGIALGIASTSLKVLLGVDRSYLSSGDE